MGGYGSGTRGTYRRKRLVETCASVSIQDLKEAGILRSREPEWRWEGILPEPKGHDGFAEGTGNKWPMVRLPGDDWVSVEEWHPRFGGASWWFHCPKCDRRSLKLYRPPGQHWFYCRRCWNLTYWAAQNAHFYDRGRIGFMTLVVARKYGVSMKQAVHDLMKERKANALGG